LKALNYPDADVEASACPSCDAPNSINTLNCAQCDASLIVGRLESLGSGYVSAGHVFALRARDYTVGTQVSHDIILPNKTMPLPLVNVRYHENGYVIEYNQRRPVSINDEPVTRDTRLEDGDVLSVGKESFTYRIDELDASVTIAYNLADRYYTVLNMLMLINRAEDPLSVFELTLEAVLRLTNMTRGTVFAVSSNAAGQPILNVAITMSRKGKEFIPESQQVEISRSILADSLHIGASIVVDDTSVAILENSPSIRDLRLGSIVCVPIRPAQYVGTRKEYSHEQCLAIVYADSNNPLAELPPNCEALLNLLGANAGGILMRM
jgi:hypothetical protein